MIQAEIVAHMAQASGITHEKAGLALDAFYNLLAKALCDGNRVLMPGIGSLVTKTIAAHPGRNPRTGETLEVAAQRKTVFRQAQTMKKRLADSPVLVGRSAFTAAV